MRRRRPVVVAAVCALVTVVAYGAFLGWDQAKDIAADGSETGPYQSWQVIALAVVLGATAFFGGWRRQPWVAAPAVTVPLLVCWVLDSAGEDGSGLWIVGAAMVAVFGGGALLVAAVLGDLFSRSRAP